MLIKCPRPVRSSWFDSGSYDGFLLFLGLPAWRRVAHGSCHRRGAWISAVYVAYLVPADEISRVVFSLVFFIRSARVFFPLIDRSSRHCLYVSALRTRSRPRKWSALATLILVPACLEVFRQRAKRHEVRSKE